jgi:hypothetical protein
MKKAKAGKGGPGKLAGVGGANDFIGFDAFREPTHSQDVSEAAAVGGTGDGAASAFFEGSDEAVKMIFKSLSKKDVQTKVCFEFVRMDPGQTLQLTGLIGICINHPYASTRDAWCGIVDIWRCTS